MEELDNKYFVTRIYWPWIDDGEYCLDGPPDDWGVRLRFGRIFTKVFRDVKILDYKITNDRIQKDLSQNYKTLGKIFSKENAVSSFNKYLHVFGIFNYTFWRNKLETIAGFDIELFDDRFVVKGWKKNGETGKKPIKELMLPKYQKRYRHAMYKRFGFKYLWHLHRLKKQEQIKKELANNQKDTKEENLTM